MAPRLAAMKVEEGHFCLGTWYKPEDLLARLIQPTQLKEHKQRFDIVIVEKLPGRPCAEVQGVQEQ
eukprot:1136697-Pelagomonas_calceolata.AAC.9